MLHKSNYGETTGFLDCQYLCICKMLNASYRASEGNLMTVNLEVHVKHPQVVKSIKVSIL